MKSVRVLMPLACLLSLALALLACQTNKNVSGNRAQLWEREMGAVLQTAQDPAKARQELNIQVDLIPEGQFGRRIFRELQPKYITIHSTQNPTGDAFAHAKALKKGALRGGVIGYLCWHFTVQEDAVIQHIPTNERGEHADFDGPGNRYSIGIEMCEHEGDDRAQTLERTAKLAASLMYYHNIPIENIRAHYHWPRAGYSTPNKNCPHFLLEGGMPGPTWRWFVGRINQHHQRLELYQQEQQEKQLEEERRRKAREMVLRAITRLTDWVAFRVS